MALVVSRSALEFLRRSGVLPTPRVPSPRADYSALLIHSTPRDRTAQNPAVLLDDGQGVPPGDRGPLDVWPPPQEVSDVALGQ